MSALAVHVACFVGVSIAGCSSDSEEERSSEQILEDAGSGGATSEAAAPADSGGAGGTAAGGRPACLEDATTSFKVAPPATDSGACPSGFWQNSGRACNPPTPISNGACGPTGDGLCYRLCATSDDCPDPCAPACKDEGFFMGGDTPAGYAPVCQAGEKGRLPPSCEPAHRTCWTDCKNAGLTLECAIECRRTAMACASEVCEPALVECQNDCAATQTEQTALTACTNACTADQMKCQGSP